MAGAAFLCVFLSVYIATAAGHYGSNFSQLLYVICYTIFKLMLSCPVLAVAAAGAAHSSVHSSNSSFTTIFHGPVGIARILDGVLDDDDVSGPRQQSRFFLKIFRTVLSLGVNPI